ncbi:CHAT domain-containing protein [Mycobacterium antarcticum]|uniref:CHAT domain-containing protein n=1 Tax=unclassified Mycolicibacterium TaxID=2636767 RepID=UPI002389BE35|nr:MULTISPECIES: CHAT domain-containing protein [unclassified Mycolicibacterium]GLP75628.1 CHAT domain-containing protein [Mycolicibacterium sp. TUM20983]GLP84021.1 CHAT domain-containing protein [Mycolicibacterium sp. TUM20984]
MGGGVLSPTLILRFADVGVATYASLRVVEEPARTLTWVVKGVDVDAVLDELGQALPEPTAGEPVADALARALREGSFATAATELSLARRLGAAILSAAAWDLLRDCGSTSGTALFVSPSARLGRVPWVLLAPPDDGPDAHRLVELADVLMAVPPNIVNAVRPRTAWADRRHRLPFLVLDPRVPGQRPDSALGSVLGRPSAHTRLAEHFADDVRRVLPKVAASTELFRRTDADRDWFAAMLAEEPRRLLYVGHASVAEDRSGRADQAALHLAEEEPLTAAAIMGRRMPMPPRVALVACASGGDYRFDEATGLVAAMILCGAQLVTATLWSLPTTAGYRHSIGGSADPMADLVIAVDDAHDEHHGGSAINEWQRECLRQWRSGDATASPLYWAALVTFAVDGAR